MKVKTLLFFVFTIGYSVFGQYEDVKYLLYNSKNELNYVYKKEHINDSTVRYTSYSFNSKEISQVLIRKQNQGKGQWSMSKTFSKFYVADNLKSATNIGEFVAEFPSDSIEFIEMEIWNYYFTNFIIDRIELKEYGRYTQLRQFSNQNNYSTIKYYRVKNDSICPEPYAKDSILVSRKGRKLKRYYFRWDEPLVLISKFKGKKRIVSNPNTKLAEYSYFSNSWDFNEHLLTTMTGEGAIFNMYIMEFQDRLTRKTKTMKGPVTSTRKTVKRMINGRLKELLVFCDGKLVERIELIYT